MTERSDSCLRCSYCVTSRAFNASCKTCFGTGRRNCVESDVVEVTELIYVVIYIFVTAVTGVGGVTFFRTSRLSYAGCVCMTERTDSCLRYKHFITNRAMLTLGKSGSGTGRSDRIVYNLGVSESINGGLRYNHLITSRAV